MIHVSESDIATESTSAALPHFSQVFLTAFYHTGHLFGPTSKGVTGDLPPQLSQHSISNIQERICLQDGAGRDSCR
jgi:hypothetical protein